MIPSCLIFNLYLTLKITKREQSLCSPFGLHTYVAKHMLQLCELVQILAILTFLESTARCRRYFPILGQQMLWFSYVVIPSINFLNFFLLLLYFFPSPCIPLIPSRPTITTILLFMSRSLFSYLLPNFLRLFSNSPFLRFRMKFTCYFKDSKHWWKRTLSNCKYTWIHTNVYPSFFFHFITLSSLRY